MPLSVDQETVFQTYSAFLVVAAVVLVILFAVRWLLLRKSLTLNDDLRLHRRLGVSLLSAVGVVVAVLALPVTDAQRNLFLTGLGLVVSGVLALSSTTVIANVMAGLMLHSTKRFRTGDFLRVSGEFGRITEKGLLYTEIQTEDRELTTLPNVYLITNPMTVVRSSGTLVSANLSLGYDVHQARVEPLLLEAAMRAELEDPFVRVLELGNFSVTYRVSGFLADIKNLLTVRSNLHKMVLDVLHGDGIEIVSPTFMNQRPLSPDVRVIPTPVQDATTHDDVTTHDAQPAPEEVMPEEIMFDKADQAERAEAIQLQLKAEITELDGRLTEAKGEDRDRLEQEIQQRRTQLEAFAQNVKSNPLAEE